MSKIFTINKDFGVNYLASIQRIENITPIPNADKLVKTTISGYDMIIPKDMKVGDLVVYFPCESCICDKFLSANNLFDRSTFERNSNADEVRKLIEQAEKQEGDVQQETLNKIRSMCGFFNSRNRVRILKLRGEYSQGFAALLMRSLTSQMWTSVRWSVHSSTKSMVRSFAGSMFLPLRDMHVLTSLSHTGKGE